MLKDYLWPDHNYRRSYRLPLLNDHHNTKTKKSIYCFKEGRLCSADRIVGWSLAGRTGRWRFNIPAQGPGRKLRRCGAPGW